MVLAHARQPAFERPNPTRIAAMSGSVLVHLLGVALLMIPIAMPTAPPRVQRPEKPPLTVDFHPVEVEPVPIELPPIPPPPTIRHHAQPVETTAPVATPVVVDAPNPIAVTTPPTIDTGPVETAASSGPIEVSSIRTIVATAPRYPLAEARRGVEGTVYLRILIGTDGLPLRVDLERTSGSRNLDKAAREHVFKTWRFEPATRDGLAVQAWARVPIAFSLDRG